MEVSFVSICENCDIILDLSARGIDIFNFIVFLRKLRLSFYFVFYRLDNLWNVYLAIVSRFNFLSLLM